MNVVEKFSSELTVRVADPSYRLTYLPDTIAAIATALLPVDGASLSLLSDDLRMPLAASDERARSAEMAQFTLGDGPCMDTYRTKQIRTFTESELAAQWPLYLQAISARTPYRSVASLPLELDNHLVGALDLYLVSPNGLPASALDDAHSVAALATATLNRSPHNHDPAGPVWLHNPATQERGTAWIAIGLMARAADVTATEALDLIRAYAGRHDQSIDDVSYQLASHTLAADELLRRPLSTGTEDPA